MEDRFSQQLKKGVLEMLVLKLICDSPGYGYELLSRLKDGSEGMFSLKEGTLYPILYRLEDDGLIESEWLAGEGRMAPKKVYSATAEGRRELERRVRVWGGFSATVETMIKGAEYDE